MREREMKTPCYSLGLAVFAHTSSVTCCRPWGKPSFAQHQLGPLLQDRIAERCKTCSGCIVQPGLNVAQPQLCSWQKGCRKACD